MDCDSKPLENSRVITTTHNGITRNTGFYLVPSIVTCSNKYGNKEAYSNFRLENRIVSDSNIK